MDTVDINIVSPQQLPISGRVQIKGWSVPERNLSCVLPDSQQPEMASSESDSKTTSDKFDPNNLYALIIGINKYSGAYSLKGAVPDAKNFNNFLSNERVPVDHRSIMLDSTRGELISAFAQLKEGKLRINKYKSIKVPQGCAFVLFYAGHGGRTAIPKEWNYHTPDGKVEHLVPSDIGRPIGSKFSKFIGRSSGSKVIQGIPDRTIAAVLAGLIERIGDNVVSVISSLHLTKSDWNIQTVILDCVTLQDKFAPLTLKTLASL